MWWIKIAVAFLCAHFVEVIGREESTLELLLQSFYYKDVISGTVVACILVEYVSRVVQWLDKKYDWVKHTFKRLVLQTSFGIFACALLAYFLVNLQFRYVLDQRMEDTTWFYYEFPFVVLLIVLVNISYVTLFFVLRTQTSVPATSNQIDHPNIIPGDVLQNENIITPVSRQVLHVKKGNKTIPVTVNEIAYIFKDGDLTYLRSFKDETYLIDATLEALGQQLDPVNFFRANRQIIMSLHSFKSFSPEDYGKLKVFLNPPSMEHTIISQKRAPLFKKWVNCV
jgi:hypothetical protein